MNEGEIEDDEEILEVSVMETREIKTRPGNLFSHTPWLSHTPWSPTYAIKMRSL